MSLFERIGRVVRANINSLLKEAEDPEKILEKAVTDMEQELIEMRRAVAGAIATQKSTERQIANHHTAAQRWYERAQLALDNDNEVLAREALVNRQSYYNNAQALQAQLEKQSSHIVKFKQDLRTLEVKYTEAKNQKSLYLARLRSAAASQKMQELVGSLNSGSSVSVFEQIETKIIELEAHSELTQISATDNLEQKFAVLEGENQIEVELTKMKTKQ